MDDNAAGMKEVYKRVLGIQNASNLSGVLQSWAQDAITVRRSMKGEFSNAVYRLHPVNVLYLSKVASLMGCDASAIGEVTSDLGDMFHAAYKHCKECAK